MYLDLVVLLNFLVDTLLLLGTNRLTGFPLRLRRCCLAGALGGLYAGVCILPGFRFLGNLLWRTVALGTMGIIAFGVHRSALRRCGLFFLLSLALGGTALGVGKAGFLPLILGAAGILTLTRVGIRGDLGQMQYVPVEIVHHGKTIRLTALRDTGNTLRDPITGSSVLVVDGRYGQTLLQLSQDQLLDPVGTLGCRPGLRLVPFSSVGNGAGMMIGYRFRDVKVGKQRGSVLVAFAPQAVDRGEGYQALTGGAI